MDVIAADTVGRTIEGVVVPYGEVGRIAGVDYRFRPGSVQLARARTPLLLDHDRGRPIGVLAQLIEGPAGAVGRFLIDRTPAGDEALAQAASGSRGSLSIGAEVEAASDSGDGVLDVTAGRLMEVSLLALGAFAGAVVTHVAAEADDETAEPEHDQELDDDDQELDELDPDQTELPVDDDDPQEGTTMTDASAAPPMIITAGADRPAAKLGAGELVTLLIRAQHGETDARRYLEAALTESISTDVSGLLPPQYERDVIGGKSVSRVLYETFRSRPLPGVGLAVNKPKWTTPPVGAWAASVDADATTSKVVIGSDAASIERWDWAGAISWVVVQRSDPSIIDEIYSEAVQSFYMAVEQKISTLLGAAPTDPATTLGTGIANFYAQCDRTPEVIVVAPDVWGAMADAKELDAPIASGDVTTGTVLRTTFAGIPIVASPNIGAGGRVLATRRAVDARTTEPVRLTANAIGALNVELAVVGEGLFVTDWDNEVLQLTAGALTSAASRSKA
jgi:phage head maturation protease